MKPLYQIIITKPFDKSLRKLISKNEELAQRIQTVITKLAFDPFDSALRTHKVLSRNHKEAWSSRINGDLRIIWNFDDDNKINIYLLDIGGHSGQNKVYT